MLFTKRVKSAIKAPFQYRPETFDAVRVSHPVNVLLCRVIDGLMHELFTSNRVKPLICPVFVGVNRRALQHILLDYPLQDFLADRFDDLCHHLPGLTIPKTEYRNLADCSSSLIQFLAGVLVVFLAPDEGLVPFDDAGEEFVRHITTGGSDTMLQMPSRFIRYPNLLR